MREFVCDAFEFLIIAFVLGIIATTVMVLVILLIAVFLTPGVILIHFFHNVPEFICW